MLYLVRHANPQIDPAVAASQWRLSQAGIERARQLAEKLEGNEIQAVVSSPEHKSYQTAQILAQKLGLEVEIAEGLHEHVRPFTPDTFVSIEQFTARIKLFFAQPDQVIFGEESANQCFDRFNYAIRQVIDQHPDMTLVAVSHGTVMSLLLSRYNHLDAFTFWKALDMPTCISVDIPDLKICQAWKPRISRSLNLGKSK